MSRINDEREGAVVSFTNTVGFRFARSPEFKVLAQLPDESWIVMDPIESQHELFNEQIDG